MLNKKGVGIVTSITLSIIIGAIVLGIMAGLILPKQFPKAAQALGIIGGKIKEAVTKEEFVPYEDQLTDDERKVDYSMNSLRCAINSLATGKPGFSEKKIDKEICPGEDISIIKKENKITSNAIFFGGPAMQSLAKTTARQNNVKKTEECQAKYGDICLSCKGSGSKKIILGIQNEEVIPNKGLINLQVADAVYDCFKRYKENPGLIVEGGKLYNCYILDARQLRDKDTTEEITITEDDINFGLENGVKYSEYGKEITGGSKWDLGLINKDQLSFKTIKLRDEPYCVYYDLSGIDGITVGDCPPNLVDSMVCTVNGFSLPQDVSDIQGFVPRSLLAYGKPRWIAYYESFPQEKTVYWKKSFAGKLLSWDTLINVGLGAALNFGFAKAFAAPVGKEIAEEAATASAKKATIESAKEAQEKITKEVMEAGGETLFRRFAQYGNYNTFRSLFIEEALQKIPGISDDAAAEVTERILKVAGKKGGKVTFEKTLKKKMVSEIDSVLKENIKKGISEGTVSVPKEFFDSTGKLWQQVGDAATDAYKEVYTTRLSEELTENIIEKIPMKTGDGVVVEGVEGIFGKRMTKEAVKKIIKSESYEIFFRKFLTEGAEGINQRALTETVEKTIEQLDNIVKVEGEEAVNSLLNRVLVQTDELIQGAPGGTVRKATELIEKSGGKIPKELFKGTVGMSWEEFVQAFEKGKISGAWHVFKELQPIKLAKSKYLRILPGSRSVLSVGKTIVNVPSYFYNHRYPILALLILANEFTVEQEAEMVPIGSNTLAVTEPFLFGRNAKPYELNEEVSSYFITNKDKRDQRLYLASPCVSDFKVVKKTCTCVSDPVRWRWNFGGGLIDISPGSIEMQPTSIIREEAIKEANSGQYGLYNAWKNAVPLYFRLKNKGINIDKLPNPREVSRQEKTLANNEEWKKFISEFPQWNQRTNSKLPNTDIYYENIYDVALFNDEMSKEGIQMSQEEMALEMWVQFVEKSATDFFETQTKPYSNMIDVKLGWFGSQRENIDRNAYLFIRYSPYIDTSKAVKVCDSRGMTEHIGSVLYQGTKFTIFGDEGVSPEKYIINLPEYKIDCIEVIPDVKEGYCYDYYKSQEYLKWGVVVASAVTDITISIATGGTAAPLVFLATGAASGLVESLISSTEVWPTRGLAFV